MTKAALHRNDRRRVLAGLAAGALAGVGAPGAAEAAGPDWARVRGLFRWPRKPQPAQAAGVDWAAVRRLFPLKPGLAHLNSANLAPSSKMVLETERAVSLDVSGDPSFENRLKFEALTEETRRALAEMLGADADEIAITRNTSESNRTVVAGLDLKPGDEVLIWSENHESNNEAWDVWAQRYGFTVVRVRTPARPQDPAELAAAFTSRFTARTRLLAFSHVSNVSGAALPAEQLCRAARDHNILTLIDGAQTFGMKVLNLHDLGCDFFSGSAHKWLAGPHEAGVLYVRSGRADRLWPSMVTHNWEVQARAGARKFDCLGQRQEGRIRALRTAVDLQTQIGRPQIEARIRQLAAELRAGLEQSGAPVDFVTPASTAMNAGIVMFHIPVADSDRVAAAFYDRFKVSGRFRPSGGRTLIRLSPNIYNSAEDLDAAVRAAAYAAARA